MGIELPYEVPGLFLGSASQRAAAGARAASAADDNGESTF